MSTPEELDSNAGRQWNQCAQFSLRPHAELGANTVHQMLQDCECVELPPPLLRELGGSVYNAITRIAGVAANTAANTEVAVTLFMAAGAYLRDGNHTQADAEAATVEPGWGFFLVERRLADDAKTGERRAAIEFYCYQEGQ